MSPTRPANPSRASLYAATALLAIAALAAWANSFRGPFVLDDLPAIAENATIRHFATAFSPPGDGQTVSGRPLVNFSFAVNWSTAGADVRGYHAFNLAIHALAALALFGVVRRTLRSKPLAAKFAADATPLAFAIAAIWLLHPLQTESVTYISQRAESLAGLCLLLTLYAAMRGAICHPLDDKLKILIGDGKVDCHLMDDNLPSASTARTWQALAVVACLLGMASKEIMYAAPLLVLLHDRTFLAGTFREALRRRPWFYFALAATWLLLAWLVKQTGDRGATAGFGLGISPWHYLLTQCEALTHYLRLTWWPVPQVLDYGVVTIGSLGAVWLRGLLLIALGALTLIALVRRPTWGFLGAWFFLLLAPSSSVLPIATQTIAEHRMYLPLAAVVTMGVLALWTAAGRRILPALLLVPIALGVLTARRNTDYHSAIGIWEDTAAKRPGNARAFGELANSLYASGQVEASLPVYAHALQLMPGYPKAHHNYAGALIAAGRLDDAASQYEIALAQLPTLAEAHYGLGNVRRMQGRFADALASYDAAIRLRPDFALAHNNAANLLAQLGRTDEALAHFAAAVRAEPEFPDAEYNWGNVLATLGRFVDAVPHYEAALRLAPAYAAAHENLGITLLNLDRVADGIRELETAQRLAPDRESIRTNLAAARARAPR